MPSSTRKINSGKDGLLLRDKADCRVQQGLRGPRLQAPRRAWTGSKGPQRNMIQLDKVGGWCDEGSSR